MSRSAPFFLALLTLVLASCKKPTVCQSFRTGTGDTRLIASGDSQTAGHATESSPHCGYGWPNMLAESRNYTLVNTAAAGTEFTSEYQYGVLMSFPYESTDVVIISAGYNDAGNWGTNPTHLQEFLTKLEEVARYTSSKARIVLITTPFIMNLNPTAPATTLYRSEIRQLVQSLNISNLYVGDIGNFVGDQYFIDDRIHYNLLGQELLLQEIMGLGVPLP